MVNQNVCVSATTQDGVPIQALNQAVYGVRLVYRSGYVCCNTNRCGSGLAGGATYWGCNTGSLLSIYLTPTVRGAVGTGFPSSQTPGFVPDSTHSTSWYTLSGMNSLSPTLEFAQPQPSELMKSTLYAVYGWA